MPISIVVGGQFGSEGKGKIASYIAQAMGAAAAVRVGGPNSGHSVVDREGNLFVFKHLPTSAILDGIYCIISAGTYIDPSILRKEIEISGLDESRLIIDPNAMIIQAGDIQSEQKGQLIDQIGSTGSGTGAAVQRRTQRKRNTELARDCKSLANFIRPTIPLLRSMLDNGKRIILEGTQGFGLSLLHSPYYPFATSRDTTAAGVLSESGLSPVDVDDVVLVLRSFPIRVGGNSGPLPREVDWDFVTRRAGSEEPILEYTSVTKKVRRVAEFDPAIVLDAIRANMPTRIALNHIDYFDVNCRVQSKFTELARREIAKIETMIEFPIELLSYGPATNQIYPFMTSDRKNTHLKGMPPSYVSL